LTNFNGAQRHSATPTENTMNTAAKQPHTPAAGAFAFSFGQAVEGGFFAGIVRVDGQRFGVVVAPKARGESKGAWGKAGKRLDAIHFGDGMANTEILLAAESPIAKWARELNINGHTDWYVPARDELELVYRNLKPGDSKNYCTYRDGENPSSQPQGHLYTEGNPAQTTAADFQSGGAEAMEEGWYWSSSQYSASSAFVQGFSDGAQGSGDKDDEWRVRAVRRFLIP
jgi:hypothetical protein